MDNRSRSPSPFAIAIVVVFDFGPISFLSLSLFFSVVSVFHIGEKLLQVGGKSFRDAPPATARICCNFTSWKPIRVQCILGKVL